MYFWPGWSAQAEFKDGVACRLTYRRNSYLGDGEIQSLLQANGGVTRWRETTARGAKARLWYRDDGANAQCAADRPTGMVFHGSRELTPSESILNESFLKFAAPENPTAVAPAKAGGRSAVREPMILSNAAPGQTLDGLGRPDSWLAAGASRPAEEMKVSQASTETIATPQPASSVPPAPSLLPTVAPTLAESRGMFGLILFASAALAVIGLMVKMARTKKAPRAPAAPRSPAEASPPPLTTASAPPPAGVETLRWDQFELLVGEIFRRQGYAVELSAALGADGGIDLMLRRDGECIPVQCKHWKTSKVAAREMREFYGTMTDAAAPRGIFVTTGSFTRDAREFATGQAIELLDGSALDRQIAAVRRPEENLFDVLSWIDDFTASARIFDPECPFCRGAMVIRHNRSSGAAFWGCTTYPRCAGKRDPRTDLLTASTV